MTVAAQCPGCQHWYRLDAWRFDALDVRTAGRPEPVETVRTAQCPGCGAQADETSLPMRQVEATVPGDEPTRFDRFSHEELFELWAAFGEGDSTKPGVTVGLIAELAKEFKRRGLSPPRE